MRSTGLWMLDLCRRRLEATADAVRTVGRPAVVNVARSA